MPNKIKLSKQTTDNEQQPGNDIKHLAEENQRIDDQSLIYAGPDGCSNGFAFFFALALACRAWSVPAEAAVPLVIMYAKQSHNKLTT